MFVELVMMNRTFFFIFYSYMNLCGRVEAGARCYCLLWQHTCAPADGGRLQLCIRLRLNLRRVDRPAAKRGRPGIGGRGRHG